MIGGVKRECWLEEGTLSEDTSTTSLSKCWDRLQLYYLCVAFTGNPSFLCAQVDCNSYEVTKRRSSRACMGNPKPEQETIKGTHARETSLPTQANHTAPGARKQPPNKGAIHVASEDTTHTSNQTACHQCSKRRPARHPPRAQQVPSQHTHN